MNQVRDALSEFASTLKKFTLNPESDTRFVRFQCLEEWLRTGTNIERLLEAVYKPRNDPTLPITPEKIKRADRCALRVFSILLHIGQGEFIELFHRHSLVDRGLPFRKEVLEDLYKEICRSSTHLLAGKDINSLVTDFVSNQYAFCPMILELDESQDLSYRTVLPVIDSHKTPINEKGGTASVWQVTILEEFIHSSLRSVIKTSRYEDDTDGLGPRYRIALKTFQRDHEQAYRTELVAFKALAGQDGMIKYLGDFSVQNGDQERSYNILLEYGQLDLDEYFFDCDILPPVLPEEIHGFWQDLFGIAAALGQLHNFTIRREEESHDYHGLHADIKPDNILWVDGKFKLADPGFASFKKVDRKKLKQRAELDTNQNEDATLFKGGTVTFGAPECHFLEGQHSEVTRAIDIWSLGCVFSVAATWIVLGPQGIVQFQYLRFQAINELQSTSDKLPCGDYFHDGTKVLPIVIDWHNHLRCCNRATDTLTSTVLDLIEAKMLCTDPRNRIAAKDLEGRLSRLLSDAKSRASPTDRLPLSFREALRKMDKSAWSPSTMSHPTPSIHLQSNNNSLSVETRKARQSLMPAIPLRPTAHRSTVLRMPMPMSMAASSTLPTTRRERTFNPTFSQLASMVSEPEELQSDLNVSYTSSGQDMSNTRNPNSRISINSAPPSSHTSYSGASSGALVPRLAKIPEGKSSSAPGMLGTLARSTTEAGMYNLARGSSEPSKPKQQTVSQAFSELESRKKGLMSKFRRSSKKEDYLQKFFGNRDLHFLVDNAHSMSDFWDEAKIVLKVLVEKAYGQDENGMDLSFTNGPLRVRDSNEAKKFTDMLEKARPSPGQYVTTNMCSMLGEILTTYLAKLRDSRRYVTSQESRKLTIIIFTDGIWEGMTQKSAVGTKIAQFARAMERQQGDSLRERQVTFQFIQFGDNDEARELLESFDNDLAEKENIPDLIDTTDSRGDVYKMLLGSFNENFDKFA